MIATAFPTSNSRKLKTSASSAQAVCGLAIYATAQFAAGPNAAEPSQESANAFGDWRGLRPALERRGVSASLHYTGEVQGNPSGGASQGAVYQGLGQASIDIDLAESVGWKNAIFHFLGYSIQGESLTANHVDDLNVASNLDALVLGLRFDLEF